MIKINISNKLQPIYAVKYASQMLSSYLNTVFVF